MNEPPKESNLVWFGRGASGIASVPALMIGASMIGFGVLCRESGITLSQAMFMTAAIWALPSQVILVGSVVAGASIFTTALAVSLSAVRLMPMLAAWAALVRAPNTPAWKLLILSHFVAVTSFVFSAMRLPDLPEYARLPFFVGFALTLTSMCVVITGVSFEFAGALPTVLAGALFFVTPLYFLTALSATARIPAERLGLAFGLALGPFFAWSGLPLGLIWAGLLGGAMAYAGDLWSRRRA